MEAVSSLQETLFEVSAKVPRWKNREEAAACYAEACAALHLPADLYSVELFHEGGRLQMNFRKNHYRIGRKDIPRGGSAAAPVISFFLRVRG